VQQVLLADPAESLPHRGPRALASPLDSRNSSRKPVFSPAPGLGVCFEATLRSGPARARLRYGRGYAA